MNKQKKIFKQSSGKWPQLISKAVGSVVNTVSPFGDVSGIVSGALQGLLDLQPGSQTPRLKYEHGKQLIAALAEITQTKRIILVLDQWEQSENLVYELEHLPQRDALLEELRRLQQVYAEDTAVCESLANGLLSMLHDAKVKGDLPQHDALREELHHLQQAYPGLELAEQGYFVCRQPYFVGEYAHATRP